MKKIISLSKLMFVIGFISLTTWSCKKTTSESETTTTTVQAQTNTELTAYYFHATRRCATCEAVESVTKETLKEYYGDKIAFVSINREKEKENPMIKEHKISGQTLLLIKDEQVVNLTNVAFMNARTNPDKLKAEIKAAADSMI